MFCHQKKQTISTNLRHAGMVSHGFGCMEVLKNFGVDASFTVVLVQKVNEAFAEGRGIESCRSHSSKGYLSYELETSQVLRRHSLPILGSGWYDSFARVLVYYDIVP